MLSKLSQWLKKFLTLEGLRCFFSVNPSCTKVFGIHTFYKGGQELSRPPMISNTIDSTAFNFDRPLGPSNKSLCEVKSGRVDDQVLSGFLGN